MTNSLKYQKLSKSLGLFIIGKIKCGLRKKENFIRTYLIKHCNFLRKDKL